MSTTKESFNTEIEGVGVYVECTRYKPVREQGDDFEQIEDVTVFAGETDITTILSDRQLQEITDRAFSEATPISGNGAYRIHAMRAVSAARNIPPEEQEQVAFSHA